MSNKLAIAGTWLAGKMRGSVATAITYTRGSDAAAWTATVGRSIYEELAPSADFPVNTDSRDYIIDTTQVHATLGVTFAAWLASLAGSSFPIVTDVVTDDDNGLTCGVMRVAGQPHYRWADPQRTLLRVHTKVTAN